MVLLNSPPPLPDPLADLRPEPGEPDLPADNKLDSKAEPRERNNLDLIELLQEAAVIAALYARRRRKACSITVSVTGPTDH